MLLQLHRHLVAAPEGLGGDAEHESVGLAGHRAHHRFVLRAADQVDQLVEVGVGLQRDVRDADAADVIGDAHRPHVVELRLHARIGGRDQDGELLAPT
jgi:hypothetical protein